MAGAGPPGPADWRLPKRLFLKLKHDKEKKLAKCYALSETSKLCLVKHEMNVTRPIIDLSTGAATTSDVISVLTPSFQYMYYRKRCLPA